MLEKINDINPDDNLPESYYYFMGLSDVQNSILDSITKNPGIRYRELLRSTGLSNGGLTYHLKILEKMTRLSITRQKKATRYFPIDTPTQEALIIPHLRIRSQREIIFFLLKHDLCTFNEIVEHLKKAPSTISWHLKRLCEDSILLVQNGEYHLYRLPNKEFVKQTVYKYKESLTDNIIDDFIDMANEL